MDTDFYGLSQIHANLCQSIAICAHLWTGLSSLHITIVQARLRSTSHEFFIPKKRLVTIFIQLRPFFY